MVQKRETKAINKLCVREILSLSFVCGAYFFEFRGRNLVCFGFAYNFMANSRRKQGRHACALLFSRVLESFRTVQFHLCRGRRRGRVRNELKCRWPNSF